MLDINFEILKYQRPSCQFACEGLFRYQVEEDRMVHMEHEPFGQVGSVKIYLYCKSYLMPRI